MGDHLKLQLSVQANSRGMKEIGNQSTVQAQQYFSSPFPTSEMHSWHFFAWKAC